jgi:hypothetical protein
VLDADLDTVATALQVKIDDLLTDSPERALRTCPGGRAL